MAVARVRKSIISRAACQPVREKNVVPALILLLGIKFLLGRRVLFCRRHVPTCCTPHGCCQCSVRQPGSRRKVLRGRVRNQAPSPPATGSVVHRERRGATAGGGSDGPAIASGEHCSSSITVSSCAACLLATTCARLILPLSSTLSVAVSSASPARPRKVAGRDCRPSELRRHTTNRSGPWAARISQGLVLYRMSVGPCLFRPRRTRAESAPPAWLHVVLLPLHPSRSGVDALQRRAPV